MELMPLFSAFRVHQAFTRRAWVLHPVLHVCHVVQELRQTQLEPHRRQHAVIVLRALILLLDLHSAPHAHWARSLLVLVLLLALFVLLALFRQSLGHRALTALEVHILISTVQCVNLAMLERTLPTLAAPARRTVWDVPPERMGPSRLSTALQPARPALQARTPRPLARLP